MRARLEGAMARRRLRGWQPPLENINSLVASGGPRLLARARELVVTNGYAGNACEAFAANLVGDGIKPSSLIEDAEVRDRVQRLWLAWTDEADADGLTDFYGLQGMVAREMFVAGECFVRLRPRRAEDGLLVPLQLQLLQSEMLPFEKMEDLGGGRRIRCGIEFDAIGRRLAYHFRRRHPGDSTDRGSADPGDGAGAGERGAAHLPADRRRPDQGPAACGAGDGAAVPARPVRRRRARPEEDRGDVRGLHHQDRARGGAARRDAGRRRRHRHGEPGARHAAGAAARRGREVLVAGRCRRRLRGVPVPDAARGLGLARAAVSSGHRRRAPGELLEPARRARRVPPPGRAAAARGDRAPALPPDLGAVDGGGGARRRARSAGLRLGARRAGARCSGSRRAGTGSIR